MIPKCITAAAVVCSDEVSCHVDWDSCLYHRTGAAAAGRRRRRRAGSSSTGRTRAGRRGRRASKEEEQKQERAKMERALFHRLEMANQEYWKTVDDEAYRSMMEQNPQDLFFAFGNLERYLQGTHLCRFWITHVTSNDELFIAFHSSRISAFSFFRCRTKKPTQL